ncbi:MAG: 2-phosphosulfolactate phosphatase [Reichenbachiella sp.]
MKPTIDVCLSPNLIDLYDLEGKIVVVVDILRATSVMVTAMAHGVKDILPVATLDEAKHHLEKKDYICAAERGGDMVDGFSYGNSPFSYMHEDIKGKSLVMTTTNGTLAITKSTDADEIIIGAFLNISTIAEYLSRTNKDVIIHCAGWKGKTNMEDTLFAGALVEKLLETHDMGCDTPSLALSYYQAVKNNLVETVKGSAHAIRLNKLNIEKDITFCLDLDVYDVIPKLSKGTLILD